MKFKVWAPEPSGGVGADGLLKEKMRLDTTPIHRGGAGARQPGARAAEVYPKINQGGDIAIGTWLKDLDQTTCQMDKKR